MRELNGDELRRRADAGEALNAHEELYERLYWALQYWGANGQEGNDAARAMTAAFVEETYKSERDVIARELADKIRADAIERWTPKPGSMRPALGAEDAMEGQLRGANLIDPWPGIKLPDGWQDAMRSTWLPAFGADGSVVGFMTPMGDEQ